MDRNVSMRDCVPIGTDSSPHGTTTVVRLKAACVLFAALALALLALAQSGHSQQLPELFDGGDTPGVPGGIERPTGPDAFHATGLALMPPNVLARFPRTPLHRGPLPRFVNFRNKFPGAGSQGRQGSCTGWAVAYARTYYRFKARKEAGTSPTLNDVVSPAYIYDSIRTGSSCNTGTTIGDALRLIQQGAVSWPRYPYDPNRCRRPAQGLRQSATAYRVTRFFRVDHHDINQVKAELAKGHPVVIGVHSDRALHRLKGKSNSIWRSGYPTDTERQRGHAVVLFGYGDKWRTFFLINSWGKDWGINGGGGISYETFTKRVHSAWTMRPAR